MHGKFSFLNADHLRRYFPHRWFFENLDVVECAGELPYRFEAVRRSLRKGLLQNSRELRGQIGVIRLRWRRRGLEVLVQQIGLILSGKRGLPANQLKDGTGQAVQICPSIERFVENLFRRHVAARALNFGLRPKIPQNPGSHFAAQSKIDELHIALVGYEKILGFDVPMHIPLAVKVGDALNALENDFADQMGVFGQPAADERFHIPPAEPFHGEVRDAFIDVEFVDLDDSLVVELARDLVLPPQRSNLLPIGAEFFLEEFQRDVSMGGVVVSLPQLGRCPKIDGIDQPVRPDEGSCRSHGMT